MSLISERQAVELVWQVLRRQPHPTTYEEVEKAVYVMLRTTGGEPLPAALHSREVEQRSDYPEAPGLKAVRDRLVMKIRACEDTYDPQRRIGLDEALRVVDDAIARGTRTDSPITVPGGTEAP